MPVAARMQNGTSGERSPALTVVSTRTVNLRTRARSAASFGWCETAVRTLLEVLPVTTPPARAAAPSGDATCVR